MLTTKPSRAGTGGGSMSRAPPGCGGAGGPVNFQVTVDFSRRPEAGLWLGASQEGVAWWPRLFQSEMNGCPVAASV